MRATYERGEDGRLQDEEGQGVMVPCVARRRVQVEVTWTVLECSKFD